MERLLALAIVLQSLELFLVRRAYADDGVFRWPTLRREFAAAPYALQRTLDALLGYRGLLITNLIRLGVALALPLVSAPLLLVVLLTTSLLVCLRFRGSYNGGSDAMTLVVLTALMLARIGADESYARAGLAYAAVQLTLSYLVAGLAKLREPSWRSGMAVVSILKRAPYASTRPRSLGPHAAPFLSWAVIGFECVFPCAWLGTRVCLVLLTLAFLFHVVNHFMLGLNRFLWAWLACYPALLYWSSVFE